MVADSPLVFDLQCYRQNVVKDASFQIKLNLVQEPETAQHDTGFVMWPASVVLARWMALNPSILHECAAQGADVLEIGAGCGLVGLTAATLLQQQQPPTTMKQGNLIFSDYNPTVLENLQQNIRLNDHLDASTIRVVGLDFFDQDDPTLVNEWVDMQGIRQPQVQLVLGADVLAYTNDAVNVARTLWKTLAQGGQALVVTPDEGLRFGVQEFPTACRNLGLHVTVVENLLHVVASQSNQGNAEADDDASSSSSASATMTTTMTQDLGKTIGYNNQAGYAYCNILLFMIQKPFAYS